MVEDELDRPWFKQTKRNFREKGEERSRDESAVLPGVWPEVFQYPPETRQALFDWLRFGHVTLSGHGFESIQSGQ